jgi:hypothetical protein
MLMVSWAWEVIAMASNVRIADNGRRFMSNGVVRPAKLIDFVVLYVPYTKAFSRKCKKVE